VRIGVLILPTDPWPETVERVRRLESLGYDHLWTYDHLSWRRYRDRPWHAAIPWLAGVAGVTERIRLGTMVASPNFRHPITLAKDVMTLDHISGGRVILGLGAGGLGFDHTVLGNEGLSPRARVRRFSEFVEVVDRALRNPAVSHQGEFYAVDEARMIPGCVQQPRLPIAIAAGGPKTIHVAARFGDAWITWGDTSREDLTAAGTERAVRRQTDLLADSCASIGRDPDDIDRIYLIGNTEEQPLVSVEAFEAFIDRYEEFGFTDVVLHHPRLDDPVWNGAEEIIENIATEILPRFHR
jgi:alkanesulfonate monooxygenase SsuD/methylene tetrahydromethanopterin reductase-like flavin-dependent oxidoreductase (luciferase family)